ncbi:hypothetical protein IAG41_14135 [Sphingomonas sp. JC676]|uniref:hypothetical protein n=1 Tax=Sphingomonas sp. JC676 TaxID=2768065 RepID=UPI001657D22A|nr:hypothetical protein [Sphingomonas sp. JC676]MBC9033531.1 hypothetical protein [Sphingomonas sp. JC676]
MRAFKLILAFLPVVYCGWLLFYFLDQRGGNDGPVVEGLGPTVIGLGVVGLLFCIPLVFKLIRLVVTPRGPESDARHPDTAAPNEESSFDADAALARYLARKQAEAQGPSSSPASFSPQQDGAPQRPSFGRKIG